MSLLVAKRIAKALAIATLAATALVGCGSKKKNNNLVNNQVQNQSVCPNGICPPGMLPPGACMPLNGGYNGPQGPSISFMGSGIYADGINIIGGQIPPQAAMITRDPALNKGLSFGQMVIGSSVGIGGSLQKQSPDGFVSLSLSQGGTGFFPGQPFPTQYPNQFPSPYNQPFTNGAGNTVQGYLSLSPSVLQDIYMQIQYGRIPVGGNSVPWNGWTAGSNPYQPTPFNNWGPMSQVCASGIAISLSPVGGSYGQSSVYGNIYLYMNGSPSGYILYF